MTKQEAIEAMKQGKKVTHRFFSEEEYIAMEGGRIVTEEGYRLSANEFWSYRTSEPWLTDWSIYESI